MAREKNSLLVNELLHCTGNKFCVLSTVFSSDNVYYVNLKKVASEKLLFIFGKTYSCLFLLGSGIEEVVRC